MQLRMTLKKSGNGYLFRMPAVYIKDQLFTVGKEYLVNITLPNEEKKEVQ